MASPGAPAGVTLWKITVLADAAVAAALEAVLEPEALSFSRFEEEPDAPAAAPRWRVLALVAAAPDAAALADALAAAAGTPRQSLPAIAVAPVPDEDWLALNRRQFPPIAVGRFFIHGSHFEGAAPVGKIVLRLDAGPAFGSGTHETTRGCLVALDELIAERAPVHALPLRALPLRALDVGCGSGILALAIAAAAAEGGDGGTEGAAIRVVATDIDPIAAATTRENAAANGLADRVAAHAGEGVSGKEVAEGAPYDLIVANILAEPLIALAPALGGLLAPGGRLVLSGLLTVQEADVLTACRAAGLSLRRTVVLGDWSTLVLGEDD